MIPHKNKVTKFNSVVEIFWQIIFHIAINLTPNYYDEENKVNI